MKILRMFKLKINRDNRSFCSILAEGAILRYLLELFVSISIVF